jgi:hypothetical protein
LERQRRAVRHQGNSIEEVQPPKFILFGVKGPQNLCQRALRVDVSEHDAMPSR